MARIKGIGGVFFKAQNPRELSAWYKKHLDVPVGDDGTAMFAWRDAENAKEEHMTIWAPFPADTDYFEPTTSPFMVNYIVEDLDGVLEQLRAEGVWIDPKREDHDYGRFAWIRDPEGARIELWEPPAPSAS
ncbi:MAG: VOC family protein [Candidatus Eremiobacteraeota bacterium]|nr:VOC family protein [Candidatus Eremiobacteraeota bacterium]